MLYKSQTDNFVARIFNKRIMKKNILTGFLILFIGVLSAQDQKLREIWKSPESHDTKKAAIEKLKLKKPSFPDQLAIQALFYNAGQRNGDEINIFINKMEAFTPSIRLQIDTFFPGLMSWYENVAKQKGKSVFKFTTEPGPPIGIVDLENEQSVPSSAKEQFRYYSVKIQKELLNSGNLVIGNYYENLSRIWRSLNEDQKQELTKDGYINFLEQQKNCYSEKYRVQNCTCAPKKYKFQNFIDCSIPKNLGLTNGLDKLNEATLILIALDKGDLSVIPQALKLRLGVWGEVNKDIVYELVFWHLVALGETKFNSQMQLNLVHLWNEGEQFHRNGYNKRLGLDSAKIKNLEDYYSCALGVKTLSVTQKETDAAFAEKNVTYDTILSNETQEILSSSSEKVNNASSPKQSTIPSITPTKVVVKYSLPEKYDIISLRDAVNTNVQSELVNRENLHACAETRAVNDTTLELELHGCGEGKGTFAIMQVETPLAGDFFNYCSNVLADQLESFKESLGGTYEVTVIGTADKLSYSKNQFLADQRAEFVKKNLGRKVITGVGGVENIKTIGLTDQDERKVILRVILFNSR